MTPAQKAIAKRAARKRQAEELARLRTEAARIVARGVCPKCGTPLRRNLALAGWWQCDAYGAPEYRQPEHRALPACSFQTFTE